MLIFWGFIIYVINFNKIINNIYRIVTLKGRILQIPETLADKRIATQKEKHYIGYRST